jgi:hypothetical protein
MTLPSPAAPATMPELILAGTRGPGRAHELGQVLILAGGLGEFAGGQLAAREPGTTGTTRRRRGRAHPSQGLQLILAAVVELGQDVAGGVAGGAALRVVRSITRPWHTPRALAATYGVGGPVAALRHYPGSHHQTLVAFRCR